MMRLITAVALFSASSLVNAGSWGQGQPQPEGYQPGNEGWGGYPAPTPQPVEHAPPPAYPPAYTPPPQHNAENPPPSQGQMIHTVKVGGDAGFVFEPPQLAAEIGDIIHFVFYKQNHSVTQSTFAKPCNKLDVGEDSGLLPNPNNTVVPAPTWEYTVKEKEPTWWYCKQRTGNHCGKGMVFAINPTVEKTFDKFKEVAISINGTVTTAPPPMPEKTAPAAPPAPPPSTVTMVPQPPANGGAPPPYMAPGWNAGGDSAACNCACFCGVGSFPSGDGAGHYGGYGGSLPSPWKPKGKQ